MLQFGIILSLMLIISSNAEFNMERKNELQHQVNLNKSVLIQSYLMHLLHTCRRLALTLVFKLYF